MSNYQFEQPYSPSAYAIDPTQFNPQAVGSSSAPYDPHAFAYSSAGSGFDLAAFSSAEHSPQPTGPFSPVANAQQQQHNAWELNNTLQQLSNYSNGAAHSQAPGLDHLHQSAFLASFGAASPAIGSNSAAGPSSGLSSSNARFHPYGNTNPNSLARASSAGMSALAANGAAAAATTTGVPPQRASPTKVAYPPTLLGASGAQSPAPSRPHPLVDAPSPRHFASLASGLSPHPLQRSDSNSIPAAFAGDSLLPQAPQPGSTAEKMQGLFRFLDGSGWTVGDLLFALSSPPPGGGEHRRRLDDFLGDRERAGMGEEEAHGPETIMRLWIEGTPGAVSAAAAEAAHATATPTAEDALSPASAYNNGNNHNTGAATPTSDIAMSETSFSTFSSAPDVPNFTGRVVIPPTQADILGKWLMKPGRPLLAAEKQSIKPEHMRIYSSLSPLELHIRGAELCRVILIRDGTLKQEFVDRIHSLEGLVEGPKLHPSNACDFASYSDYDLWHHSVMTFLQLSTRYPTFGQSKPAVLDIMPSAAPVPSLDTETPSFSHATHSHLDLHSHLLERALRVHWEDFRLTLQEKGGLLRSAVKAFATHKKAATPIRLLAICDDVATVGRALSKSVQGMDRILPYDPLVSAARNSWRQRAFWSEDTSMIWSLSTIHFLEISVMFPRFVEGVRELPTLQGLLAGSSFVTGV